MVWCGLRFGSSFDLEDFVAVELLFVYDEAWSVSVVAFLCDAEEFVAVDCADDLEFCCGADGDCCFGWSVAVDEYADFGVWFPDAVFVVGWVVDDEVSLGGCFYFGFFVVDVEVVAVVCADVDVPVGLDAVVAGGDDFSAFAH